jgi:hypothetical protein
MQEHTKRPFATAGTKNTKEEENLQQYICKLTKNHQLFADGSQMYIFSRSTGLKD